MYNNKHKTHKKGTQQGQAPATLSGDVKMPLTGFRATFVPDVESIKLVYSDYRVITAAVNQAEYVYRLNSLFDPDFSGVGGQPDGFDFWKAYYTIYRVVAAKVEVQVVSNTIDGNGLLAIAATDSSGSYLSAEEVAGLRKAKASTFTQQQKASLRAVWHMGELMGRNDESILADNECAALMTANPTNTQYLHVAVESGNSATQASMMWVKITYYARFERAIATLDSATRHRLRFQRASLQTPPSDDTKTSEREASYTTAVAPSVVPRMLGSTQLPSQAPTTVPLLTSVTLPASFGAGPGDRLCPGCQNGKCCGPASADIGSAERESRTR
jgi:hypothetical protein